MRRDFHLPGRSGLDGALQPAIRCAEEGVPVARRVAYDWSLAVDRRRADAGASRHFLPAGRAPVAGDKLRVSALAATLRAIAQEGPRAFYQGAIAQDIVSTIGAPGS